MSARASRRGVRGRPAPGFTLVEVLVTLAVASVLLAFVYQIFISQQRSQGIQEEVADAQQNARVASEELSRFLTSLGAGAALEEGQVRILVAHPDEIVFNADLSPDTDTLALPPGTSFPGGWVSPQDPYQTVPGTYTVTAATAAETYRFYLGTQGVHSTLYRQMGYYDPTAGSVTWGSSQQVALNLANQRIGEPLFRYHGDFGGGAAVLDTVDTATSPRVAAGDPLDALIQRIEINVVTETANADPRYPDNQGYRLTRLNTSIAPRNLWDCPLIAVDAATIPDDDPTLPGYQVHREGALLGQPAPDIWFRVTRGGVAEPGQTVTFALAGLPAATVTASGVTDANGRVAATITWPPSCAGFPTGPLTLTATTAGPLSTPFGLCAPNSADVILDVIEGLPSSVSFDGVTVTPGLPATANAAHTLDAPSCGGTTNVAYTVLDFCAETVRPADVQANPVPLEVYDATLQPSPGFGTLTPNVLDTPTGTFRYATYDQGPYSNFPSIQRSNVLPNPYAASIRPATKPGQVNVAIHPIPDHIANLTNHIATANFSDCPDPAVGVADTFGIEDLCNNPLTTLAANPFGPFDVTADLHATTAPAPGMGSLTSAGNPSALPLSVVIRQDDGTGQVSTGTPGAWVPGGSFEIRYVPPVCGLGAVAYHPEITLTPSWSPTAAPPPIPVQLAPCTSCSVRVLDSHGAAVTHLSKECAPEYWVEVTHCNPAGTTVELVIDVLAGGGSPSFSQTTLQQHLLLAFPPAAPPGAAQTARARLYVYDAYAGNRFQLSAHLPDAASAGTLGAVTCQSDPIDVDTSCDQILITPVPDNPGAVPSNPSAEDTPLCAAEGAEVFFRVKDCDQNERNFARDDILNTAGTNRGLLVEVVDTNGVVLDREGPDLFEVDIHGTQATDSPYFQGSLSVTQDPNDTNFSGHLLAPVDRVVTLRARYVDPNDPGDNLCVAEALLVPPLPVCLAFPVQTWGNFQGDLAVRGGDLGVVGNLLLPPSPHLIEKSMTAPLGGGQIGGMLSDRFFNAYVGGTISVGGSVLTPTKEVDQPFTPAGAGHLVSITHPNYFQNVPDAARMMSRLDYDRLKLLARAYRVYWEAVPSATGWMVSNPAAPQLGPLPFAEATRLGGLGGYDGKFVFVDAGAGFQSSALVDGAALGDLPTFVVSGDYYTEGLIYVAGSVVIDTAAGQRSVTVDTAAPEDARYDEDAGGFTRADLPIDFAASPGPAPVGNLAVNVRGALYADGEISLPGGPKVYGAIAAERGIQDAASAGIWYDPHWRESQVGLCTLCCGLTLTPLSPAVALGNTLQLAANQAKGQVTWGSLAPQIATVNTAGVVTSVATGLATIRAVDESGCVAEAQVRVFCDLRIDVLGGTAMTLGGHTTAASTGHHGSVAWSVDGTAVDIVPTAAPAVFVNAVQIGAAQLTATDALGCSDTVNFTVNP